MKTSVVFSSKTGNTQQLANAVAAALPKQELLYTGAPNEQPLRLTACILGSGRIKAAATVRSPLF